MDCTYIALFYTNCVLKVLYNLASHSPIHTQWVAAAMQGAAKLTGGKLGFNVLPKDTLTCWTVGAGIEPPALQ